MLRGLKITREDGHEVDYSDVYVDFDAREEEQIIISDISNKSINTYIKLVDLISGNHRTLSQYPEKYDKKIENYKRILTSYDFSIISIKDASIDIATEIFTRLNVGGRSLSLFEIMVAKTYDYEKKFDLSEKFDTLIEELEAVNYDTISDATVLQIVSMIISKDCTRKKRLKIAKERFIKEWDDAISALKSTIDYFRSYYRIPVSRLLPYNALLVPFSYYFYKYKNKPIGEVQKKIQNLFWRISFGNRYSSGVENKIAQDVARIDLIVQGGDPKYEWAIDIEPDDIIDNGWFGTGRSYIKAILSILSSKGPKSFDDNATVNVDNSWLKIASSKNYHHFFPKSYMSKNKKEIDYFYVNNIVNITIVDDFLNKRKIKNKAPSIYISDFASHNPNIDKTLKTHLINGRTDSGINDNNFDKFLKERAKCISKEIKKRIITYKNLDPNLIHYEESEEENI